MSEARRRRMRQVFRTVHREGQGIMQIEVYTVADLAMLVLQTSDRAFGAIARVLEAYYGARDSKKPALCFCCCRPVTLSPSQSSS